MSNQDPLQALLVRHCASIKDETAAINAKLEEVRRAAGQPHEVVRETLDLVHKINGSSGSLGFLELSNAAASLENLLKEALDAPGPSGQIPFAEIIDLFAEVKSVAERTRPEHSSLFGFDLNRLKPGRAS